MSTTIVSTRPGSHEPNFRLNLRASSTSESAFCLGAPARKELPGLRGMTLAHGLHRDGPRTCERLAPLSILWMSKATKTQEADQLESRPFALLIAKQLCSALQFLQDPVRCKRQQRSSRCDGFSQA